MYYPSSEIKGADKLRGYREADLRLCFRLCGLLVFPWGGSNVNMHITIIVKQSLLVYVPDPRWAFTGPLVLCFINIFTAIKGSQYLFYSYMDL